MSADPDQQHDQRDLRHRRREAEWLHREPCEPEGRREPQKRVMIHTKTIVVLSKMPRRTAQRPEPSKKLAASKPSHTAARNTGTPTSGRAANSPGRIQRWTSCDANASAAATGCAVHTCDPVLTLTIRRARGCGNGRCTYRGSP